MEQIISKEEVKKITRIKGKVRGMGMKTHAEFIVKKKGEESLKKLEDAMVNIGHPVKYKSLRAFHFYPLSLEALTLVMIEKLFHFRDEEFQELGKFHARNSVVIRTFLRYFLSIDTVAENIAKVWRRYFTEPGEFKVIEFDKEKRRAIFRIENFDFHPIHCQINIGIFIALIKLLTKSEASCKETKCVYKNDEYDEFLVEW